MDNIKEVIKHCEEVAAQCINTECAKDHQQLKERLERLDDVENPKHYTSHPSGVECIEITQQRKIKELIVQYDQLCDEFVKVFCEKHDMDYAETSWAADEIGGTLEYGDYYIPYEDIITDLMMDAECDCIWKYNEYILRCAFLGIKTPNYKSYLRGCPIVSDDKLCELESMKKDLEMLIETENEKF